MLNNPTIAAIAEQLKVGVLLLEQVHILAQTQTLVLDDGDLDALANVVESKDALVQEMMATEQRLAPILSAAGPEWIGVPELVLLKERALDLIRKIAEVERKNRDRLETLRTDAISRSRAMHAERSVQHTYGAVRMNGGGRTPSGNDGLIM